MEENVLKDKRFSHVVSNPRFKKMPYKDNKVKIDKRFQSMFTDKRFQVKYKVDERGRTIDEFQSDNYKKYYDLTDSSDESDSDHSKSSDEKTTDEKEEVNDNEPTPPKVKDSNTSNSINQDNDEPINKINDEDGIDSDDDDLTDKDKSESVLEKSKLKEKLKQAHRELNQYVDGIHKQKLNEKVKEKLSDITVDYARGIGTLLSGSESSSDESSSEDSETEAIEHPWGELDKDAETTEEISRRLAVCNMDWDRVTAKDLMVLFNSFLPSGAAIESITIYPSEFGLARMAEEEIKGPKELVENVNLEADSDEEIEEGSSYQREKLREYQLKRLKYYYAIIVCNTEEAANVLYTECDGLEYESSATKLDLRFVGDDVEFDQKPHDVCTTLPDLKKYKPRLFINTALQQGKVDLTWDETDPNRVDFTRKVLAGEEVDENEFQTYIASSSSEEEDEKEKEAEVESDDDAQTDQERIMKYRALISNLQEESDRKRGDVEMEVSWGANSSSKDLPNGSESRTKQAIVSTDEESDNLISDDEVKNKKSKNKRKTHKDVQMDSEDEKNNAELELLLADDNPEETGRKHFSLAALEKEEKESKKKKKWRKNLKKKNYQEEDTFKIDTKDERFSALFTSHHFNIDPADPHFRKTKAMNDLIAEKQKRRKLDSS